MAAFLQGDGIRISRDTGSFPVDQPADLYHFHGLWNPGHLRLARYCRRNRIPVIVSPHGMLEPWAWRHRRWKKWPYFQFFEKKRLSAASALMATAAEEADNLRTFFPNSKIEVLPLGIDPAIQPDYARARRMLDWSDDEKVLLYLSRVHPKKGLKELLDALLSIRGGMDLSSTRLVIVGDGPAEYVEACRSRVKTLREIMTIDWHPPIWGDGKWPYLQGADLFCLPTYSENFGIVVLEAGMVGTPVFTTTGTPWSIIGKNRHGWVVDPDPALYAPVLTEFLQAPASAMNNMREAFADWTRLHYSWPGLAPKYQEFYRAVVKGDQGA